MIAKVFAVVAVGVSAVNAACSYPPPLSNQLVGNSVTRPDLTNPATINQAMDVVWDAAGLSPTITLILLRGPGENIQYLETIVSGASNTGSYSWTPHCGLEPDVTRYGIMIMDDQTCKFQWSSQFGMNAGDCGSSSSSSVAPPKSSTTAPPKSSSKVPPPTSSSCDESESVPPPKTWSTSWGGPPPAKNSTLASTSTYWLPAATSGAPIPSSTYKPIQANGAGKLGMSLVGAAGAFAVAFMLL